MVYIPFKNLLWNQKVNIYIYIYIYSIAIYIELWDVGPSFIFFASPYFVSVTSKSSG